jgi:8-oxo-dGTP pyrophosphatase MutT (NUDIX family)
MVNMTMARFSISLLKERLSQNPVFLPPPPGLIPAGVLVPLFYHGGMPHLIFTQRTMSVKNHRGQIAFPGGVQDPKDSDLLATALRETKEEIGLKPELVEVLGSLSSLTTVTGYRVSAYAALIPYPYHFRLNPHEVKRLLLLSVESFCDPQHWGTGTYTLRGQTVGVCYWRMSRTIIWGATARILLDLLTRWGENPLSEEEDASCLD